MKKIIMALLALLLVVVEAGAASVQARLVRANNRGAQNDPALKDIETKLKAQFGYNSYRQTGAGQQEIKTSDKLRFDLGEDFRVLVTPKSADKKQRELEIEWYSGKTLLVRSTVKVIHNGHVFINGPQVGENQILLAVSVRN